MELRLMTFNIRNGRGLDGRNIWWLRRRATASVIAAERPDVVGLQEVYRFQLRYLAKRVGGYDHVGVGRNNGAGKGEHAPLLYGPDRFELERTETRWLSDTPRVPGSKTWGNRSPRIVTLAWLRERATGRRLGVVSGHLDEASAPARRRSAEAILQWLNAADDRPWFVLGDLNTTADDPAVQVLLQGGYRDTLADLPTSGPGAGTEHAFTGRDDGKRIDFVLVPSLWSVVEACIVRARPGGRLPSDHWPVTAVVADG
jgi:endonuclease/exonuclease/phosphatase family metal-dependent hydrolase